MIMAADDSRPIHARQAISKHLEPEIVKIDPGRRQLTTGCFDGVLQHIPRLLNARLPKSRAPDFGHGIERSVDCPPVTVTTGYDRLIKDADQGLLGGEFGGRTIRSSAAQSSEVGFEERLHEYPHGLRRLGRGRANRRRGVLTSFAANVRAHVLASQITLAAAAA